MRAPANQQPRPTPGQTRKGLAARLQGTSAKDVSLLLSAHSNTKPPGRRVPAQPGARSTPVPTAGCQPPAAAAQGLALLRAIPVPEQLRAGGDADVEGRALLAGDVPLGLPWQCLP